ncbi:MAG: acyl-CoA synthetase [Acidimicrobiales bacterium]
MTFNLADLFECAVDAVSTRTAMVTDRGRFTYGDLDERANRLANHLTASGIGAGDHVGLMLLNGTEYVEGMLAAYKIRAVPINVNYRYVENELRYLFDDADLVGLILHRQFGERAASIAADLPKLRTYLVVEDDTAATATLPPGTDDYEVALAKALPDRPPHGERSGDDIYIAYTGGTTGMPKGVMWRHEDIFFASMGGGDPFQMGNFITSVDELPSRIPEQGMVALPTPPFMHVSAHWMVFITLYGGGSIVLPPGGRFDPDAIWDLVAAEKVNMLVIVGDAMARPLLEALPRAADTSSLFVIGSGGAILSPSTRAKIVEALPNAMIIDGYGASETGVVGTRSDAATPGAAGPRFTVNEQTAVLDDDGVPVVPGSGAIGRLARRGHIPLGYYGDPVKTAATFITVEGVRWVLPGDMATVDGDGSVTLLGRGSVSINTGGEKVFPEEVESVLKAHPGVADAVVVGVPDHRWGERVVAVVQPVSSAVPTLDDLRTFCRDKIAGYKVPRGLSLVDVMVRSPAGKADYRWAKSVALGEAAEGD